MSFDSVDDNKAFADKFGFSYPLLCDTDRALGLAYGACDTADAATPRRISYLIGADGNVRKAYDNVNAAEHPAQVLEDIGS